MNILMLGSELGGGFLWSSILAPDCWLMPLMVSPPGDKHLQPVFPPGPWPSKPLLPPAFADDEARLHGWNSEGELLQATGGPHVPVALPTAPAPASAVSRGASSLDAPQQVRDDFGCVLSLVRRTHDLCYPVRGAAVVWGVKGGGT